MYDQSNVERTLYGFGLSPYMSQIAHLLSETGLTYRYERVSPYQESTLTPEQRKSERTRLINRMEHGIQRSLSSFSFYKTCETVRLVPDNFQ